MNNLKPYTKYKPSNIAWLGDIPEHWEVRKLRFVAKIKTGRTPKIESSSLDYFNEGSINWFTPSDFKNPNGYLISSKRKINEFAIQNSQVDLYPENTVFLIGIGATIGKIGISQLKSSANQQLNAIMFKESINPKFGYYSLLVGNIQIKFLADFTTLPILNQSKTKEIFTLYPPFKEQQSIANFLDYKLSKIDRFIQKKKQLIKLLNEQKAGIINDAVTKGLNPNAKMKPSGIEWLGDIPEHWEVRKLKYVAESVLGKMLCNEDKGGYYKKPYLKSKNIQWLNVNISDVEEMWFSDKELVQYRLKKGDLVLSEGGEVGKTCLWDEELEECYIQNSAHKVTMKQEYESKFYLYLFYLYGNKGAFDSITNKVSIGHLTKDKLINLKCLCPSHSEQTAIVQHIEQETAQINAVIQTIEKEITLTQEYRVALIAEAVTGKIDVRAYEIPETPVMELYEELEDEMSLAAEEEVGYSTEN